MSGASNTRPSTLIGTRPDGLAFRTCDPRIRDDFEVLSRCPNAPAPASKLHTGWATLVAVAEEGSLCVLHRCRVELLPPEGIRFVYHQAAELPIADAERLIESVRRISEDTALTNIRGALKKLDVTHACIVTAGAAVPNDLAAALRSHAHIHAAEGALYARVAAGACANLGVPVLTVREREVWSRASENTGVAEAELKARIDDVRKAIGPPWTADHKIAAAAALVRA